MIAGKPEWARLAAHEQMHVFGGIKALCGVFRPFMAARSGIYGRLHFRELKHADQENIRKAQGRLCWNF